MKMKTISFVFALLLVFSNAALLTNNLELDNNDSKMYVNISGKEYYIGYWEEDVPVAKAIELCDKIGMDLINFEEEKEYVEVTDYLFNHFMYYDYFWTGGHRDAGVEWTWGWANTEFKYSVWGKDQPDVSSREPACMYFSDIDSWIDENCDEPHRFICETRSL